MVFSSILACYDLKPNGSEADCDQLPCVVVNRNKGGCDAEQNNHRDFYGPDGP